MKGSNLLGNTVLSIALLVVLNACGSDGNQNSNNIPIGAGQPAAGQNIPGAGQNIPENNQPPVFQVPENIQLPADSYTTVTLTASDADGDPLETSWNLLTESIYPPTLDIGTNDQSVVITGRGRGVFEFEVIVSDGYQQTSGVFEVKVVNAAPATPNVRIEPAQPTIADRLLPVNEGPVTDADLAYTVNPLSYDLVLTNYIWFKNGELYRSYWDGAPPHLPGDTYAVKIETSDGWETNQGELSDPVTVQNSEGFVIDTLPAVFDYGVPVSFNAVFTDDDGNPLPTELAAAPDGVNYANGIFSWTPEPFMLGSNETYHVMFKTVDATRYYHLDLTVQNLQKIPPFLVESTNLPSDDTFIDLAGWTTTPNGNTTMAIVTTQYDASGIQSVGVVDDTGLVSLTQVGSQSTHPTSRGSFVTDVDNDGIDEIVFATGNRDAVAIQHRSLNDLTLLNEHVVQRQYHNYRGDYEKAHFKITDLVQLSDPGSGNTVAVFATDDHIRRVTPRLPFDIRVHAFDLDAGAELWNIEDIWSIQDLEVLQSGDILGAGGSMFRWSPGLSTPNSTVPNSFDYEETDFGLGHICDAIETVNKSNELFILCVRSGYLTIYDSEMKRIDSVPLPARPDEPTRSMTMLGNDNLLIPIADRFYIFNPWNGIVTWTSQPFTDSAGNPVRITQLSDADATNGSVSRVAFTADTIIDGEATSTHLFINP